MPTHATAVRDFVDAHLEEVLADLEVLVSLETPSQRRDLLQAALPRIEALLVARLGDPETRTLRQVTIDDAAAADEIFSVLMGEDVEARRGFIQRNAKDVRFLDI